MKREKKVTMGLMILVVGTVCSLAYGQEENAGSNGWQIEATPYFWMPSLDLDATVAGSAVHLDMGFDDVMDSFDVIGFSGRIEMWKGDWGLLFDGQYVDVDADFKLTTPGPGLGVGVDIEETILDFGVAYKLIEEPIKEKPGLNWSFAPIGGFRYHYLKEEINLKVDVPGLGSRGTTLGGDEEWVELFVGGQLNYDLSDKLTAMVRADFGGFGIGSASKLTWNFLAGVDYQLKENMSLKLGYKVFDMDYERGNGASNIGFDGKLHGPIIGLTILF
jgi:opacity protein-like surface antigen